jgi:hypothetical protein
MESFAKESKFSFTSSLDIFSVPESDFSVVDYQYVAITPKSTLTDEFAPILFHVPPNPQAYYDFGSFYLVFSAKVTNKDGTALTDTDSVARSSLFFLHGIQKLQHQQHIPLIEQFCLQYCPREKANIFEI